MFSAINSGCAASATKRLDSMSQQAEGFSFSEVFLTIHQVFIVAHHCPEEKKTMFRPVSSARHLVSMAASNE